MTDCRHQVLVTCIQVHASKLSTNAKFQNLQDLNSRTFWRIFKYLICFQALSRALKFLFQIQAFSRISQARYEPWLLQHACVVVMPFSVDATVWLASLYHLPTHYYDYNDYYYDYNYNNMPVWWWRRSAVPLRWRYSVTGPPVSSALWPWCSAVLTLACWRPPDPPVHQAPETERSPVTHTCTAVYIYIQYTTTLHPFNGHHFIF